MVRVINLLGASLENATRSADEIVAFETNVARVGPTAVPWGHLGLGDNLIQKTPIY